MVAAFLVLNNQDACLSSSFIFCSSDQGFCYNLSFGFCIFLLLKDTYQTSLTSASSTVVRQVFFSVEGQASYIFFVGCKGWALSKNYSTSSFFLGSQLRGTLLKQLNTCSAYWPNSVVPMFAISLLSFSPCIDRRCSCPASWLQVESKLPYFIQMIVIDYKEMDQSEIDTSQFEQSVRVLELEYIVQESQDLHFKTVSQLIELFRLVISKYQSENKSMQVTIYRAKMRKLLTKPQVIECLESERLRSSLLLGMPERSKRCSEPEVIRLRMAMSTQGSKEQAQKIIELDIFQRQKHKKLIQSELEQQISSISERLRGRNKKHSFKPQKKRDQTNYLL